MLGCRAAEPMLAWVEGERLVRHRCGSFASILFFLSAIQVCAPAVKLSRLLVVEKCCTEACGQVNRLSMECLRQTLYFSYTNNQLCLQGSML